MKSDTLEDHISFYFKCIDYAGIDKGHLTGRTQDLVTMCVLSFFEVVGPRRR